jgi:hypothetical protein
LEGAFQPPPPLLALFVVSNSRNGGHHSSAAHCSKACTILLGSWWEVKACSPTLGRRTHSTTLGSPTSTAPPSLDARLRHGHCGSGGHNSPPPLCARRRDGMVTLVARGGLRTQVFRGRQSLFGGFRWVDGVGGRVYVESSLDGAGEGSSSSEETRPPSLMLFCLFCRRGGYDVGWFRPRAGLICWSMQAQPSRSGRFSFV